MSHWMQVSDPLLCLLKELVWSSGLDFRGSAFRSASEVRVHQVSVGKAFLVSDDPVEWQPRKPDSFASADGFPEWRLMPVSDVSLQGSSSWWIAAILSTLLPLIY